MLKLFSACCAAPGDGAGAPAARRGATAVGRPLPRPRPVQAPVASGRPEAPPAPDGYIKPDDTNKQQPTSPAAALADTHSLVGAAAGADSSSIGFAAAASSFTTGSGDASRSSRNGGECAADASGGDSGSDAWAPVLESGASVVVSVLSSRSGAGGKLSPYSSTEIFSQTSATVHSAAALLPEEADLPAAAAVAKEAETPLPSPSPSPPHAPPSPSPPRASLSPSPPLRASPSPPRASPSPPRASPSPPVAPAPLRSEGAVDDAPAAAEGETNAPDSLKVVASVGIPAIAIGGSRSGSAPPPAATNEPPTTAVEEPLATAADAHTTPFYAVAAAGGALRLGAGAVGAGADAKGASGVDTVGAPLPRAHSALMWRNALFGASVSDGSASAGSGAVSRAASASLSSAASASAAADAAAAANAAEWASPGPALPLSLLRGAPAPAAAPPRKEVSLGLWMAALGSDGSAGGASDVSSTASAAEACASPVSPLLKPPPPWGAAAKPAPGYSFGLWAAPAAVPGQPWLLTQPQEGGGSEAVGGAAVAPPADSAGAVAPSASRFALLPPAALGVACWRGVAAAGEAGSVPPAGKPPSPIEPPESGSSEEERPLTPSSTPASPLEGAADSAELTAETSEQPAPLPPAPFSLRSLPLPPPAEERPPALSDAAAAAPRAVERLASLGGGGTAARPPRRPASARLSRAPWTTSSSAATSPAKSPRPKPVVSPAPRRRPGTAPAQPPPPAAWPPASSASLRQFLVASSSVTAPRSPVRPSAVRTLAPRSPAAAARSPARASTAVADDADADGALPPATQACAEERALERKLRALVAGVDSTAACAPPRGAAPPVSAPALRLRQIARAVAGAMGAAAPPELSAASLPGLSASASAVSLDVSESERRTAAAFFRTGGRSPYRRLPPHLFDDFSLGGDEAAAEAEEHDYAAAEAVAEAAAVAPGASYGGGGARISAAQAASALQRSGAAAALCAAALSAVPAVASAACRAVPPLAQLLGPALPVAQFWSAFMRGLESAPPGLRPLFSAAAAGLTAHARGAELLHAALATARRAGGGGPRAAGVANQTLLTALATWRGPEEVAAIRAQGAALRAAAGDAAAHCRTLVDGAARSAARDLAAGLWREVQRRCPS